MQIANCKFSISNFHFAIYNLPRRLPLRHFPFFFLSPFDRATQTYGTTVGWFPRLSAIVLVAWVAVIGLTFFGFTRVPSGFIPMQDKHYLLVHLQLRDSASLQRTAEATDAVERIARETPGGIAVGA